MQTNKPQFPFSDEKYIRLLEHSNTTMYKKIKKLKTYMFLSFGLLLVAVTVYFLWYNPLSNPDIFKGQLTQVPFDAHKTLIRSGNRYYEIPDVSKKWVTPSGIMVQTKKNALSFTSTRLLDSDNRFTLYNPNELFNIQLTDGTSILLNQNTELQFSLLRKTKSANVKIEGEAYFKVAKNKDKPFHIQTSNLQVVVFGTEFNIETTDRKTAVTLINGSVQVRNKRFKKMIKPGQQAVALQNSGQISIQNSDIARIIEWTGNQLSFNNRSLTGILQQIEKWYDVRFVIKNEDLKQLKFTGKFNKQEGLLHFLQILQYTEGIQYQINDKFIILTQ